MTQLGRFTFKHIKSIKEQTISITGDEIKLLTEKWHFNYNMKASHRLLLEYLVVTASKATRKVQRANIG